MLSRTFIHWHILRRLRLDWLRTLLLLLSIAASTAVLIAILNAADESVASFRSALKPFQGGYEIRSLRGEIFEDQVKEFFRHAKVDALLIAVKEIEAKVSGSDRDVLLLGVDVLALPRARQVGLDGAEACVGRALSPFIEKDSIALSLADGSQLSFLVSSKCTLEDVLPADYSVVTDIGLLEQKVPHKPALARIVVLPNSGFHAESFRQALKDYKQNSIQLVLEGEVEQRERAQNVLSAFRLNVLVIVAMTFLVCGFVVFNASQLNVRARVPELSTMRTIGFSRRSLLALVLLEALVLGAFGALVGMTLGRPLSEILSTLFLNFGQGDL